MSSNLFIIGTSDRNEYYPVYAISDGLHEKIISNVFLFHKPKNAIEMYGSYGGNKRYNTLFDALRNSIRARVFNFTFNDMDYSLHINKGYIADKHDNILLLLSTKSFRIFDEEEELIAENLRLYVSTELINNGIYKNIYKKIEKEYIQYCYKKNIDVVFTTSEKIEQQVFSNNLKKDFKSITELHEYLNNEVENIFFFDDSIYNEESLPF